MGGNQRAFLSLVLDPWIVESGRGPRRAVLEDVRRHAILGDSLARITSLMRMEYPVADVPGHPVFYGIGPSVTDMKTGHDRYYGPEKMLWKLGA